MAKVIWHKNTVEQHQRILLYWYYEFGPISVLRLERRFRNYNSYLTAIPSLGTVNEKLTAAYGCEIRNITIFKYFKLIYIIETEGHQDETVRILDLWAPEPIRKCWSRTSGYLYPAQTLSIRFQVAKAIKGLKRKRSSFATVTLKSKTMYSSEQLEKFYFTYQSESLLRGMSFRLSAAGTTFRTR